MESYAKKEIKDISPNRANFLLWVLETIIGFMLWVILFGQVAVPLYLGISTTGWDTYTALLWSFLMFIVLAAFVARVFESAKRGYAPVF